MDIDFSLEKLLNVDLEQTMKTSFITYSMSVITARALPDVRDGLKPVHRRIIYTMNDAGNTSDKPLTPSARFSVNTTPTATLRFMTRWCGLRRISP